MRVTPTPARQKLLLDIETVPMDPTDPMELTGLSQIVFDTFGVKPRKVIARRLSRKRYSQ